MSWNQMKNSSVKRYDFDTVDCSRRKNTHERVAVSIVSMITRNIMLTTVFDLLHFHLYLFSIVNFVNDVKLKLSYDIDKKRRKRQIKEIF